MMGTKSNNNNKNLFWIHAMMETASKYKIIIIKKIHKMGSDKLKLSILHLGKSSNTAMKFQDFLS